MKKRKKNKNNDFSKLLKKNINEESLALNYLNKGDYRSAIKLYKKLIIKNPSNFILYVNLAEIYLSLSINIDESFSLLQKSISIKSNYFKTYNLMGVCLRNKGKIKESISYFKKSIFFKPNEPLTFFNLAFSYQTLNDLNNAITHYQKALDLKSDFLEALNNLGNIYSDKKEYNLALPLFKKSIKLKPDYEMAHNNIGILYGNLGNLELAINHYKKAIDINPKQSQTFNNLGNAYQKLGNKKDAEKSYRRALQINPLFFDAKNNLGTLLIDDEKYDDAILLFKEVINKNPNFSQAYSNLANVFRRIGKLKEAEKLNILSLQIEPNNPSALNNIGLLLMDENKFNLAIEKFLKALQFEQNSKTIKNLGIAYQRNFEYKKALNQYKLSLKINPKDAKTYCSLGSCFKELNQFNNAIEAFDKALFLEPSNIYALSQKKSTERQICLWDNDFNIDQLNLIVTSYDQYVDPRSIMYLADNLEIEQKLARKYFKNNFVRQAKKINLKVKNKIRVGYYSADLITHAVTILIIRLFEIYDSKKFEIYVYNFGKNKDDKYTERIKRGVTIYRDVRNYTDSQIVDLSIKDEIDIAIDLMGYTKNCRPSIFSMRVAPIQISYLGFTGTMGTNAIDYIFADKVLIKENEKYFYDEKIIYLNNSPLCFDDTLKDSLNLTKRELYGLPEKGFIFSCFNNSYKISKKEFDTWMAILDKVENSYFWLFVQNEEAKRNLIKEAKCRNINEERIIFAEKVSLEEHFSRQKLADLFLDTFNHNAGSTGVLALYGGLPIITLYGNTYHSRMTASLLSNLDLYELISYSLDEYIEKTIKIATEKTYYSKIKNKLLNSIKKNNGSISKNFVEELESQYSKLMNN